VNHTTQRLLTLCSDLIISLGSKSLDLQAIFSCGFDGSSGHSANNQKFLNGPGKDENFIATTLIPLRIIVRPSGEIIWTNKSAQSDKLCRLIKLQFVKESKELILSEYNNLEKEISSLQLFQTITENTNISVEFVLSLTLIDGKVLNVLTGTKFTQTCPICHRDPKDFNVKANIEGCLFVSIKFALSLWA